MSSPSRMTASAQPDRVAEGRELTPEDVDAIGRGRVWTGEQASELGLVDALGGLRTAVLEAKQVVAELVAL